MLMNLKDNLQGGLTVFVGIVFVLMLTLMAVGKISIESLKAKNATLTNQLNESQQSVRDAVAGYELKERELIKLDRDYRIIIDLNAQNRKKIDELKATHESRLQEANQLRISDDEPTKDWANALLPGDAVRLLNAASCQSGDQNQYGVCVTAG